MESMARYAGALSALTRKGQFLIASCGLSLATSGQWCRQNTNDVELRRQTVIRPTNSPEDPRFQAGRDRGLNITSIPGMCTDAFVGRQGRACTIVGEAA
jgi:hypothetical protein